MPVPAASSIPRLVHFIWLGSEPSPKLLGSLQRLNELNPKWEIRLWRDDDLNWLQNRSWFESATTWAGRSNIARYEIILQHGGYYVDADFEFFRPLDAAGPPGEDLVVVPERRGLYCNAIFAAAPNHPFMARLVENLGPSIDFHTPSKQPTQVSSGPHFFSDELIAWAEETGGKWEELPRDLLFPYSFDKLDHGSGPWSPGVIAVHAWNQASKGPAQIRSRELKVRAWQSLGSSLRARGRRIPSKVKARLRRSIHRRQWRPNSAYMGDGRALTVTRDGRRVIVDMSDVNLLGYLIATGSTPDESFHRFLSRTLSGSDVYVDVGANIGQYVVTAAQALSNYGRVFAYEPNPRTAQTLSLNVQMHRNTGASAEVIERRSAVSDSTEPAVLHVPAFHAGRGSMVPGALADVGDSDLVHVDVPCVTLDCELGHLSRIRLIKIDTEGHEPAVLAGAVALIESGRVDLIDIESIRAHLGRGVVRLAGMLDRWQDMGATFAEIDSSGALSPIYERGSRIVATSDRGHLVIDLRPIRERILARGRQS